MAERADYRTDLPPDPRLRCDFPNPRWRELPRPFFLRETRDVARALIGVWLARRFQGQWHGARIVETEAYLGNIDAAAHTWRGRRTQRVEPMYREGGHLYVFLVYGMHHCANVVTRSEGIGEAVLLRAAEGPETAPVKLLSGPGKLCSALGLTVAFSGLDLLGNGEVRLFHREEAERPLGISARIGINYAGKAKDWPLRFFDLSSDAVSGKPRRR
jgi:DNA-3-methyladenine glycosylase